MKLSKFNKKMDKTVNKFFTDIGEVLTSVKKAEMVLVLIDKRVDAGKDTEGLETLEEAARELVAAVSRVSDAEESFENEFCEIENSDPY